MHQVGIKINAKISFPDGSEEQYSRQGTLEEAPSFVESLQQRLMALQNKQKEGNTVVDEIEKSEQRKQEEQAKQKKPKVKDLLDILNDYYTDIESGKLKVPKDKKDNRQWIHRNKLKGKAETLTQYRSNGEWKPLEKIGGIIGIDTRKQIYWQEEKGCPAIFYLKRTIAKTSAK